MRGEACNLRTNQCRKCGGVMFAVQRLSELNTALELPARVPNGLGCAEPMTTTVLLDIPWLRRPAHPNHPTRTHHLEAFDIMRLVCIMR